MSIDTARLRRDIAVLERARAEIEELDDGEDDVLKHIYEAACVRGFNVVVDQSSMLLLKPLAAHLTNDPLTDRHFKGLLPQVARHVRRFLIDGGRAERWLRNQDDRNDYFRIAFREAAKYGLMEAECAERWLRYLDNRDDTARNYGENFAEATLTLLPAFVDDAKTLAETIERAANE